MSVEASGVSFLTLAYLIEIAVVMNLAYRELKFPELDNNLHERVNDILAKARQKEIPPKVKVGVYSKDYGEYDDLKSLVEKNGEGDSDLWGEHLQSRRNFFHKFIRNRRSLKIVNWNIVITVGVLIGCTAAAGIFPPIENVFYLDTLQKWIWVLLFLHLSIMTVLPLWFIRMATLCERHLLGVPPKGGLVQKLAKEMFSRKAQEDAELKKQAQEFKAPANR